MRTLRQDTPVNETIDVAIVGAGGAGLAVSYLLSKADIPHLVLERGEIGESWRSQRWDSFCLNTPNWSNGLTGTAFQSEAPGGFEHRDRLVGYLEGYARSHDLPIRPHSEVTTLERLPTGGYALQTQAGALHATAVVLATGALSRPRMPAMGRDLPADITSLSAGTYRNPGALPEGAVVVVGSGQSGCQIAEDLLAAGRQVYLCASRVARVPRTYRGRDILDWMRDMGLLDQRVEDLEDPSMEFDAQPQVSGTDGGHTVSLQSLARDGATLLGRVLKVDGHLLKLGDDLRASVDFADKKSQDIKNGIDLFITRNEMTVEVARPDPGEPASPDLDSSGCPDTLDLRRAGVTSVIWCTGFDADWSWVRVDVFDERGRPRHRSGITESPGLYCVGFPWLSKRKSGILYGVSEDAAHVVQHIEGLLTRTQAG